MYPKNSKYVMKEKKEMACGGRISDFCEKVHLHHKWVEAGAAVGVGVGVENVAGVRHLPTAERIGITTAIGKGTGIAGMTNGRGIEGPDPAPDLEVVTGIDVEVAAGRDGTDPGKETETAEDTEPIDAESLVGLEGDVAALMGFTGFSTTKNTKVVGNADGAVKINKQRKYRQYMNRKGGFNRPLDYIA
ncbi:hypothetical protein WR25_04213 [Diploscapter pachys]|uniref:U4/U6.U5 small nuclear ribonucleoprotein 27 kDa protein n=1 Tax=Diploscapter pachys TaxID=2018661 RepID=A0A2A2K196_9BILA|nr:hypothetical protein WR25_04213 [Diploscapter pachys]